MPNEQKNLLIEQYLNNISSQVNSDYPQLIDDEKLKRAKEMFSNSSDDYDIIIKQINSIIENMIKDRKMILEFAKHRENLSQFTLDLGNDKNGLYLSQQQIDLLIITELSSKEELQTYFQNCSQFPNILLSNVIENFDLIDLEDAKRRLYDSYLKTLDSYTDETIMTDLEKATSKLTKMGVDKEEQTQILLSLKEQGLNKTLQNLRVSKGDSFIVQFNRLMRDDFENVKSVGYDEMASLSKLLDRDKSIDTLIIATSKYDNIMSPSGNGMYFDPYLTNKALQYCEKHNLHMRYHTLFDYTHIEKILAEGKTSLDKEQILSDMKKYVKFSMEYIEKNNKTLSDGTKLINVVEVFNELVEKNKTGKDKEQPYAMKWEKEFGITIQDLISCFDGIQKPNGVEFMYNETTLTESSQKRDKVENILGQIETISPGFIDRFGDQSHLSEEDLQNNGIEIKETAELLGRIQNGEIHSTRDLSGNYINQSIAPKKIEITEHDFHFTEGFIGKMKENIDKGIIRDDIKSIKKNMQDKISTIYKDAGIKVERSTYWSIFNGNDHNLVRANKKIITNNKSNNINKPLVENMFAGTLDDGKNIDNIQSLSYNSKNQKKEIKNQQTQSFTKRSDSEILIAQQIKQKNMAIKQQKESQRTLDKPKVKTLTKSTNSGGNSSSGFVNTLVLTLITGFIAGAICMIVYNIIK